MSETQGGHLPDVGDLALLRQVGQDRVEEFGLVLFPERGLEFHVVIKIVLHRRLAATCDQDEMLDPGGAGLGDHVMDQGAIDHRKHFLRHRLGRGEHAGAQTGNGEDGLANAFHHVILH